MLERLDGKLSRAVFWGKEAATPAFLPDNLYRRDTLKRSEAIKCDVSAKTIKVALQLDTRLWLHKLILSVPIL